MSPLQERQVLARDPMGRATDVNLGFTGHHSRAYDVAGRVVSDNGHRSAPMSEVEGTFTVEQTGRNPAHHTVHLPNPVTTEVADQFNTVFKPVE